MFNNLIMKVNKFILNYTALGQLLPAVQLLFSPQQMTHFLLAKFFYQLKALGNIDSPLVSLKLFTRVLQFWKCIMV